MDVTALYRLWLEKAAGHPALREELKPSAATMPPSRTGFTVNWNSAPADCAACSVRARTA